MFLLPTYLIIFDLKFICHPLKAPNTCQIYHRTIIAIVVDFVNAFFMVAAAAYLSIVQAS
jgi:hypothetical protein